MHSCSVLVSVPVWFEALTHVSMSMYSQAALLASLSSENISCSEPSKRPPCCLLRTVKMTGRGEARLRGDREEKKDKRRRE